MVQEVFDEFPEARENEELDANPPATIPKYRIPVPKKRRPAADKPQKDKGQIEQEPVPLLLFSQSQCCRVPEHVADKASKGFFALREVAGALRLMSIPQQLSEETPFVTAEGVMECLEAAAISNLAEVPKPWTSAKPPLPEKAGNLRILRIFASAKLMGFSDVADTARSQLLRQLGMKTLRPALAAALAWDDLALLRGCYWALLDVLCRPPPSAGPKKFGINPDRFEYQQRSWPLRAFAPAAEAAARRRAEAQAPPVQDGFAICRLQKQGFEVRLLLENSDGTASTLLRASLGASRAVLCAEEEEDTEAPPRQYSEACCGVLEASRLGHRFEVHEGVELLPSRSGVRFEAVREQFPYPQKKSLGVLHWDIDLLGGLGHSSKRLQLEAPGQPLLCGRMTEAGRLELTPSGSEKETPWLLLEGPASSHSLLDSRRLCWRHPLGTALAFAAALTAVYPWDPGVVQP